jgi:CBS domain-containing protein
MTLVQHILEDARRRIAILDRRASVTDAAAILSNANTPLVVVCDADGVAVGVVSRMDLVRLFGRADGESTAADAEAIMTRTFVSCGVDQSLQSVWETLSSRGLRCAPVVDEYGRLLGVVHARDLVRALLNEVTTEELLLRDYVLGVGYR